MDNNSGEPADALYLTLQFIAVVTNMVLFTKYTSRKYPDVVGEGRLGSRIDYSDRRFLEDDGRRDEELLELLAKSSAPETGDYSQSNSETKDKEGETSTGEEPRDNVRQKKNVRIEDSPGDDKSQSSMKKEESENKSEDVVTEGQENPE